MPEIVDMTRLSGGLNLFTRHLEVSEPELSSTQIQLDSVLQGFSEGVSDWHSLAAMTAGGFAYRLTKLGVMGSSLGRGLPFISKILSPILGLGAEVTAYRGTLSLLNKEVHTDAQVWSTDFVNFASLKVFGFASRNTNPILSHALQDVGMVAGHQLAYGFHLVNRPEGTLIEQLAHAEMTNLQIGAGMQLMHLFTAGRFQMHERSLDLISSIHAQSNKNIFSIEPITSEKNPILSFVAPEEVSSLNVRDYQEEGIQALSGLPGQERDRGLVVLPTGTGKTVLFSEFAGRFSKRFPHSNILVITHREEIINQNANWLRKVVGEKNVGILQGSRKETNKHITVASVQTLLKSDVDLSRYDLVVLDEAHHYVYGNEWFRPLQQMGFFNAEGEITFNPGKFLVGVTATPDRLTGNPLNTTFGPNGLVYGKDITHFIGRRDPVTGEPYLLNPYGVEVNLLGENIQDSSTAIRQIEAKEKARIIADIFQQRLRENDRYKKSIIFVSDKEDVAETAVELRKNGIKVFALTDDVPDSIRDAGVAAYKRGEYDALVSIKIPTEGFDDPGTEAVVLGMATDSRALLVQMVGRVLRPDPLHPERTEGLIVDLGANLRRHRIGVSIQELYDVNVGPEGEGRTTKRRPPEPDTEAAPIEDVEVRELGNLFQRHAFSHVLRELLPLDDVPAFAYRANKSSDVFYNYLNALDLPSSVKEVREIATLLNDSQSRLVDAWSWDKVVEMEKIQTLDPSLDPQVRRLAERFRWGIWKNFNGGITVAVPSHNSPLHNLWFKGELPLHNQPRLSLVDFYDQMKGLIAQDQAPLVPIIEMMQVAAIRAQRNWQQASRSSTSAEEVLLSWTRDHIIDRYRGEVPWVRGDAIASYEILRPYFERGEIPFAGDLENFSTQLTSFLGRGDPSKELRTSLLIREVMRNHNEWDQEFPAASEEVTELHTWFIESVLTLRYGMLNQSKGIAHELIRKIRNFANIREVPDPQGRESMATFYDRLLIFAAENEPENLAEGKRLIQQVLKSQLGWNSIPTPLTPHTQQVLERFREKDLEDYYGQWPTVGDVAIGPRHPLRRFLENGEDLNIAEYREELVRMLKPLDPNDLRKVMNEAIWEQQKWNPSFPDGAIRDLHLWVRSHLTPSFKGSPKVLGRPLKRFLETGELPERLQGEFLMGDFYTELLKLTAGVNLAQQVEGASLIHQAIKVQRGWDKAAEGVNPDVQTVMNRFFDIVATQYWGSVPQNDAQIQRGGRLRKLLDSYQWPEYKGTAAAYNWKSFAEELKTFFRNNGLSRAEADALLDAAIPH